MKKFLIVGLGGRSRMFLKAFSEKYSENCKIVGICDNNQGRAKLAQKLFAPILSDTKVYGGSEFDQAIVDSKPDAVIVCTKDSVHDDYICRSLNAGCDVITEKPLTIDEKKCQRIIDTVNESGKSVLVTFNYRYSPPRTQIKDILMKGAIGKVLSVEFQWLLDTHHGADYFRRWHRNKKNSGGLIVHKSTHHFDLVNWWIDSIPISVFAEGDKLFYNQKQASYYDLANRSYRCATCESAHKCNFFLDIKSFDVMKELYWDCEKYDGYIRDKCVFGNGIDIEDSLNVLVRYKSGVMLNYSLNAFSPWEGYNVAFNGTKGRLEHHCQESSYINGSGQGEGFAQPNNTTIKVFPHFRTAYEVEVKTGTGNHGGGDDIMLDHIFLPDSKPDRYNRTATHLWGLYSVLIGIAANKSIKTGQKVVIDTLVHGLEQPVRHDTELGGKIKHVKDSLRILNGIRQEANLPPSVEAPM